jgi:hypothetical protein
MLAGQRPGVGSVRMGTQQRRLRPGWRLHLRITQARIARFVCVLSTRAPPPLCVMRKHAAQRAVLQRIQYKECMPDSAAGAGLCGRVSFGADASDSLLVQALPAVGSSGAEAQQADSFSHSLPQPTTSGGAFTVSADHFLQSPVQSHVFICLYIRLHLPV